jgi:hypothetical protein
VDLIETPHRRKLPLRLFPTAEVMVQRQQVNLDEVCEIPGSLSGLRGRYLVFAPIACAFGAPAKTISAPVDFRLFFGVDIATGEQSSLNRLRE